MKPTISVLTIHPEMVEGPLSQSIIGRARAKGLVSVEVSDIREHGLGKHRSVDDTPYGGGPGMVMRVDVVASALESVRTARSKVLLTSPSGRVFTQRMAEDLANEEHVVIICGHYEGIDDRIETLVDELVSLGDFVMTGGELAAVAIVDATLRLVPGVLGNELSSTEESFADSLLEHPQFTRPAEWRGLKVPDVLMSGHHARIREWRNEQQIERTRARRPDLHAQWVGKKALEDDEINVQRVDDSSDSK